MPDAPLEFVVVEPAGYCDPETGLCAPPAVLAEAAAAAEAPEPEPAAEG